MTDVSPQTVREDLADILGQATQSAAALQQALGNEREALSGRDPDRLAQAVAAKQMQVQALERLERRRIGVCQSVDASADMAEVLSWCNAGPEVAGDWNRLLELSADCDALNLGNGAAIRLRQQQVADGLLVLRGGTEQTPTYGPTGTPAGMTGGRTLTEA